MPNMVKGPSVIHFKGRNSTIDIKTKAIITDQSMNKWGVDKKKSEKMETFILAVEKGVKKLPKKRKEKIKRYLLQVISTTLFVSPLAFVTNPVMAQTDYTHTEIHGMSKIGGELFPEELTEILIQLILFATALGVGLAVILLIIAGACRMFRMTEKAISWTIDILKGLGQILIAPAIILLIVMVVNYLFGNLDIFNRLF